jgi:nitrite reductase/ring-hydroxylating ferredoxin subunit
LNILTLRRVCKLSEDFIPSIPEEELPEGSMKLVTAVGRKILLLRRGSEVFGVSNRCPHLGCSLSNGAFKNYSIICPCHSWSFDIRTGQYIEAKQITLRTYNCKIEDGKILIQIGDI